MIDINIPPSRETREEIISYCVEYIESLIELSECNEIDMFCSQAISQIQKCEFKSFSFVVEFCESILIKLDTKLSQG